MINEISWHKYGLDIASPQKVIMANELAPGGYHGHLVEPAISHSDRQSRGGSRYLGVTARHLCCWVRVRDRSLTLDGSLHFFHMIEDRPQ